MEVDMQPIALRATRSATKRARSPSSPTQYDRPSKRMVSSGHDTSVPIAFPPFQTSAATNSLSNTAVARLRNASQDWVSQTQSMRLESPASEQSGFSTPITDEGGDVRIDEVMADDPMPADENSMSVSPPRHSHLSGRGGSPPSPQYLHPPDLAYTSPKATMTPQPYTRAQVQNTSRLQIPAIQIQAATPSPVQMFPRAPLDSPSLSSSVSVSSSSSAPAFNFEDMSMASPSSTASRALELSAQQQQQAPSTAAAAKRQRFTMGPRADCELCRQRVKGHYMHFD
ncbi:hypothetical protein PYCCODRAFT_1471672 [Trametes coccinea BRFM310]|uniref:Uncharacterized protein n=1 Tax=Trametes coccinea (strain BRFM310) TaxID=1353009 RepID=A0A1Y2IA80_TRAC3|nr:hypothetical protein PYCCODRAFT_1471672 [Trametes coccinea BRFM310]